MDGHGAQTAVVFLAFGGRGICTFEVWESVHRDVYNITCETLPVLFLNERFCGRQNFALEDTKFLKD